MAAAKKATDQKILEKSLRLFNERGIHSVSAHDIASELDISSGNLTYYFKKKNDIVNALVDRLEEALSLKVSTMPQLTNDPENHAALLVNIISVFWQYRFFFNNINYLTNKDTTQLMRYQRIKAIITDNLAAIYNELIENGSLLPIEDQSQVGLIVDNAWYLLLSHLRLYLVETPAKKQSAKGYYQFAGMHYYVFVTVLYTPAFREGHREHLKKLIEAMI